MDSSTLIALAIPLCSLLSAVIVAVLNNWDKLNKGKKYVKEMYESFLGIKSSIKDLDAKVSKITSAQRTSMQTEILSKCKHIQESIDKEGVDYEEDLKQLIILYREYYLCGFNSQGRLYFNDTINKASEYNNTAVRDLMNHYFSEYNPNEEVHHV